MRYFRTTELSDMWSITVTEPAQRIMFKYKINVILTVLATLFMAGCSSLNTHEPVCVETDYRKFFHGVNGSVVFYCQESNEYRIFNPALCKMRYSPCSTFKIFSTLMGLDSGVLQSACTKMGYDGTQYKINTWNHDVTLEEAFRASCVWYYEKMIAKLSRNDIQNKLNLLNYGNCDIGAWDDKSSNVFWIESTLQISPVEQVNFLHKVFDRKIGFKPEHIALVKSFMRYDDIGDIAFYGKTGTGRNHRTGHLEAWFAGFLETPEQKRCYFAIHIDHPERDVNSPAAREIIRSIIKSGLAPR